MTPKAKVIEVEGEPPRSRIVISVFDSMEKAPAWRQSPEYKRIFAVREREANYVWAAQVDASRRAGLREEVIDLLRAKGDPSGLSADERDIVTYARQLMRTNRVEPQVFDALLQRHGAQWLVELTTLANFYVALCGVVNAFDVPAPEGGDRFTP